MAARSGCSACQQRQLAAGGSYGWSGLVKMGLLLACVVYSEIIALMFVAVNLIFGAQP